MFTPEERARVRSRVLELARDDERIVGAALTGSAAGGNEDAWSDVDVFLGVDETYDVEGVLADWTQLVRTEFDVLAIWDMRAAPAIYRVFLLRGCLQVDVAFTPASDFGARAPTFRPIFGEPVERPYLELPSFGDVAGRGWIDVLHANSSIERGQVWKAEYFLSSLRDQTLALACLRLGESPFYARGVDRLPPEVTEPLEDALVQSLEPDELRRALGVATRCFLHEVRQADAALADRLEGPLLELTG